MTGHAALARANFETGCNCAQAVLCAYPELLPRETAMKLGASLGGGIGRLREVCGAVSGMLMALGLKYGYADPKDRAGKTAQYELVRALADEFKKENGSIICRELLGLDENFKPKPPEARTEGYYKKRPCSELCKQAAEIFEQYEKTRQDTGR